MSNPYRIGPTRKFPRGKLNQEDDGELAMAIAADPIQQVIKITFGISIKWFALEASRARDLAKILNEKADELDKKRI